MKFLIFAPLVNASLAQPVEQLIRNEQVVGSSPIGGSENAVVGPDVTLKASAFESRRGLGE